MSKYSLIDHLEDLAEMTPEELDRELALADAAEPEWADWGDLADDVYDHLSVDAFLSRFDPTR